MEVGGAICTSYCIMLTFKKIIEAINDEFVQIEYYRWDDNYHGSSYSTNNVIAPP